jgi:hypothetical protein
MKSIFNDEIVIHWTSSAHLPGSDGRGRELPKHSHVWLMHRFRLLLRADRLLRDQHD